MTLTQMNYIITISETGSLNKAAEALYISQPSLTNAVKELEKELGIIIFNRSGRGVTLTNDLLTSEEIRESEGAFEGAEYCLLSTELDLNVIETAAQIAWERKVKLPMSQKSMYLQHRMRLEKTVFWSAWEKMHPLVISGQ